ncbi:MAG: FKBP-type peptidyl-prolyl cis-trans isomerase [Chitinophagales bacterium]
MNKFFIILSTFMIVLSGGCNNSDSGKPANTNGAENANLNKGFIISSKKDSVFYAIGLNISKTLRGQGFESEDIAYEAMAMGIHDGFIDSVPALFTSQEAMRFINIYLSDQLQKLGNKNLLIANRIIDSIALLKEYSKVSEGVYSKKVQEGHGAKPDLNSKVLIHFVGKTAEGQIFENSYERSQPVQFDVNTVIMGWQEALMQMQKGAIWEVVVHPDKAYGPGGGYFGQIQPNMLLIYNIELVDIIH